MKPKQYSKQQRIILGLVVILIIIAYALFQTNQLNNKNSNNLPGAQVALTPAQIANKQKIINQTLGSPPVKLTSVEVKAKALLLKQLQTNQ